MTEDTLAALEDALGHRFADRSLLQTALTHSSFASGAVPPLASNERLEFLGDRVLGLLVAEMLYRQFGAEEEGKLARRHAALVMRDALARVADEIGLADHLRLSRGEDETGGRENPGLLADACEAVIAALFLDGGLDAAAGFVRARWQPLVAEDVTPPKDAKTALQEWAQARGRPLPRYREKGRTGPDHAPEFSVEVRVEGVGAVVASGPSKRAAERAAAERMLARVEGGDGGDTDE